LIGEEERLDGEKGGREIDSFLVSSKEREAPLTRSSSREELERDRRVGGAEGDLCILR
jgi:hypothetical protein